MTCQFMMWPGSGYCLDGPFSVSSDLLTKDNLEYAVELLAAYLLERGLRDYYMTITEYDEWCKECGWESEDDMDGWLYVDGTMEGASEPIYLRIENLKFEFVN